MGYIYKDRAKFMELYEKGLNDSEIAREIGCTKSCANKWRTDQKLPTKYKRPFKYNLNGEFQALYNQGYTDWKIARKLGCTDGIVWKWRQVNNLPNLAPPPKSRPPVDLTSRFNFREYVEILDKSVEDSGVSIHTLEGRLLRDWAFLRFQREFMMESTK
jgi:transposase-like protein